MAVTQYHEIEIKSGNDIIKFTPASYTVDYQTLVGPDSGRTMDGTLVISDWILRKTTKLSVTLPPHFREDPLYSRIFSYVQGQVVKVTFYDYMAHTNRSLVEMYCSETSMGWSYKGMVNDASFELIEMKGISTIPTHITSITQYTITATVDPVGGGTVSGAGTYYKDSGCTITATPATGYHFSHWGSDTTDTNPSKTFTVTANASYTAHFVADATEYTISTSVAPAGSGSVSGGGNYLSGTSVTLRATPASGYIFSHWGSNSTDTEPVKTFTVSGNASYTANFTTTPTEYWEIVWKDSISTFDEDEGNTTWDVRYSSLYFNYESNGVVYSELYAGGAEEFLYYDSTNTYDYQDGWYNQNYKTIIMYQDPDTIFLDQDWGSFLSVNALSITHYTS